VTSFLKHPASSGDMDDNDEYRWPKGRRMCEVSHDPVCSIGSYIRTRSQPVGARCSAGQQGQGDGSCPDWTVASTSHAGALGEGAGSAVRLGSAAALPGSTSAPWQPRPWCPWRSLTGFSRAWKLASPSGTT
jgi:hypothetical protein